MRLSMTIHQLLTERARRIRSVLPGAAAAVAIFGFSTGTHAENTQQTRTYEQQQQQVQTGPTTPAAAPAPNTQVSETDRSSGMNTQTRDQQPAHDGQMQQAMHQQRQSTAALHAAGEQVRMVEQELADAGYSPGHIDGRWDDRTSDAAKRFQQANRLAPTGKLDTSLLSALDAQGVIGGEQDGFLDSFFAWFDRDDQRQPQGQPVEVYVSPAHVAQIQEKLRDAGFDPGRTDGDWNQSTIDAANQWRQQQNLPRSEQLDVALIQALDLSGVLTGDRMASNMDGQAQRTDDNQRETATNAASQQQSVAFQQTSATPLHAGPVTIAAVQKKLNDEGHKLERLDGQWGEKTRAALKDYQGDNNLDTAGKLTFATLKSLDVDVTDSELVSNYREEMGRTASTMNDR